VPVENFINLYSNIKVSAGQRYEITSINEKAWKEFHGK